MSSAIFSNRPTAGGAEGNRPPSRQHQTSVTSTATAKSGEDIIRAILAQRAIREAAAKAVASTEDSVAEHAERVEYVYARLDANAILTIQVNTLNKQKGRHVRGSTVEETRLNDLDGATEACGIVGSELDLIKGEYPLAYEEGFRLYNRRVEAADMADSNRRLLGSANPDAIRGRIELAIEQDFVVVTTKEDYELVRAEAEKHTTPAVFQFAQKNYRAVKPWDPEAVVAVSLAELISDLQSRHNADDEKILDEVKRGGYFVSTNRSGDADSALDRIQKNTDGGNTIRKVSQFLFAGIDGQRYVVKAGREFVVLENRGSRPVAIKTNGAKAGKALFTVPDHKAGNGARVALTSPASIIKAGHTITPTNLSGVWFDAVRFGLEEALRREAEAMTSTDLRNDSKGSCSVLVYWKTDINDPNSPNTQLRGQLIGSGNGTFSASGFHPASVAKVDPHGTWLAKAIQQPLPLETLDLGKWPAFLGLNTTHELDWQLDAEAEERGAIRVISENLDGLTSVENGKNSLYAVQALIRKDLGIENGEKKFRKNPVRYIVERNGSTVEIVWAVPGTSVSYANELRGKHEIANLPWRLKVILGSQYYGVRHTDAPDHLRLTKQQQEVETSETIAE